MAASEVVKYAFSTGASIRNFFLILENCFFEEFIVNSFCAFVLKVRQLKKYQQSSCDKKVFLFYAESLVIVKYQIFFIFLEKYEKLFQGISFFLFGFRASTYKIDKIAR